MSEALQKLNHRLAERLATGTRWIARNWRFLLVLIIVVAAISWALDESDSQGRADGQFAYSVGMMCEEDPEAPLWNGGCDRIASDIAKTGTPSFLELYRAFYEAHHGPTPGEAGLRRTADVPADPSFDLAAALKGTRYVIATSREEFMEARNEAAAHAIMDEIDARDRARLTIRRSALSFESLLAGALANLTSPLALFAGACLAAFFWLTRPRRAG